MAQEDNSRLTERRRRKRWSVYSFMHATATLSHYMADDETAKILPESYCAGLLVDISHEGAQITLPSHCAQYFQQGQDVKVQIKTTIEGLTTEVTAQIKSIKVAQHNDNVSIRVLFTNMENNKEACDVVAEICEYGRKFKAEEEKHANETISAED